MASDNSNVHIPPLQERSSLQSELERMHHTVLEERQKMQQRIDYLKEAFNAEAEELKVLVEMEKAELRKTLALVFWFS